MTQDLFDLVRSTVRPPPWAPPTNCLDWAREERGPLLVVAGDQTKRDALYHQVGACQISPKDTWQEVGFTGFLAHRLSKLRSLGSIIPHEWDLIWNLVTVDVVHLDITLQDLVDQGGLFRRLYRALLTIRQSLDSNSSDVGTAVRAFGKWLSEGKLDNPYDQTLLGLKGPNQMPAPYERFDACLFVATLSSLNALLGPTILVLDGLEGILQHHHRKGLTRALADLFLAIDRWARLGCPIKVILGLSDEAAVASLTQAHPPLGAYLSSRLCLI